MLCCDNINLHEPCVSVCLIFQAKNLAYKRMACIPPAQVDVDTISLLIIPQHATLNHFVMMVSSSIGKQKDTGIDTCHISLLSHYNCTTYSLCCPYITALWIQITFIIFMLSPHYYWLFDAVSSSASMITISRSPMPALDDGYRSFLLLKYVAAILT